MFREMRRVDRKLSEADAADILLKGEYGILSTVSEDGYAYGVPVSYIYMKDAIYFHCALEGHLLENCKFNPKASFCVVGATEILAEKFSTNYESVIVFGIIKEVLPEEKEQALLQVIEKYSSNYKPEGIAYIANSGHKTTVMKLCIEHMTGKARR